MNQLIKALESANLDERQVQHVFHGRGHCFTGLEFINLDWYPPALFVSLFRPVEQAWLDQLLVAIWQVKPQLASCLVVQHRQGANTQSQVVHGELPKPHVVYEGDMACYVQLNNSQNVGIFPDIINGRAWVQANCVDKNVLNLFSYTCLFSVVATLGGAKQVINVDMNKSVMSMGRKNHQLNDVDGSKAKFFTHNIFNSWAKIKRYGRYDLIIIDPPSFQKGSFVLTKDYARLIKRLPELSADNADVLLCVNSPEVGCDFIFDLVAEYCPALQFVERIANHVDFPEVDEQKSLKVLRFVFNTNLIN